MSLCLSLHSFIIMCYLHLTHQHTRRTECTVCIYTHTGSARSTRASQQEGSGLNSWSWGISG
ncbi:hypothetical protein INR49_022147 [Caranx melampygus]|nr:hypothetical protein INR49_022147 [Caranx melampygus]